MPPRAAATPQPRGEAAYDREAFARLARKPRGNLLNSLDSDDDSDDDDD